MALRKIRYNDDGILKKQCKEVKEINKRTLQLIDDMFDTMYDQNGAGLAANQVGVLKRIAVIDVDGETPYVLINPVLLIRDGEQTADEACLSFPGRVAEVTRPNHVVCKAYDRDMREYMLEGEELLARCICHELDHLDGIVYEDVANEPLRRVEKEPDEE